MKITVFIVSHVIMSKYEIKKIYVVLTFLVTYIASQFFYKKKILISRKFAPRCYGCSKPIAPEIGETSAPRLTALGNDWHPDCFKCKVKYIMKSKLHFLFIKYLLLFLQFF